MSYTQAIRQVEQLMDQGYDSLPRAWTAGGQAHVVLPTAAVTLKGPLRSKPYHGESVDAQDWKTLLYTVDRSGLRGRLSKLPREFGLILPSEKRFDTDKLEDLFKIPRGSWEEVMVRDTSFPKPQTPGTIGPWGHSQSRFLYVDKPSMDDLRDSDYTSWAFPGIDESKVYVQNMSKMLHVLDPEQRIRYNDIAK